MLAVVLAILAKLLVILKLGLRGHIKKDNKSHIFKHLHSNATCFDSYNCLCFKIMDKANSKFDLNIKEALHINWSKPILNAQQKPFNSHPLTMASVPLALFCLFLFFLVVFYAFLFHLLFSLFLTVIISILYCLNYTLLLLPLTTRHLVSHFSLSSIVFIIFTLIMGIFYRLNDTSLLFHLLITRPLIDLIITISLTYVLGNYYDLYKYHKVCTN